MRYRFRTLMLAIAVGCCHLESNGEEGATPSTIYGKWRVVAAESVGRIDPNANEEDAIWEFRETEIVGPDRDGKIFRSPCKFDFRSKPMRIAYRNDPDDGYCGHGIIRMNAGSLQLCVRIGLSDNPPEYPREFKTEKGDSSMKMLLFSRVIEDE